MAVQIEIMKTRLMHIIHEKENVQFTAAVFKEDCNGKWSNFRFNTCSEIIINLKNGKKKKKKKKKEIQYTV